jgi:hypothetical protein
MPSSATTRVQPDVNKSSAAVATYYYTSASTAALGTLTCVLERGKRVGSCVATCVAMDAATACGEVVVSGGSRGRRASNAAAASRATAMGMLMEAKALARGWVTTATDADADGMRMRKVRGWGPVGADMVGVPGELKNTSFFAGSRAGRRAVECSDQTKFP